MLGCHLIHGFSQLFGSQFIVSIQYIDHITFYHFEFSDHFNGGVYFVVYLGLVLSINFKFIKVLYRTLLKLITFGYNCVDQACRHCLIWASLTWDVVIVQKIRWLVRELEDRLSSGLLIITIKIKMAIQASWRFLLSLILPTSSNVRVPTFYFRILHLQNPIVQQIKPQITIGVSNCAEFAFALIALVFQKGSILRI